MYNEETMDEYVQLFERSGFEKARFIYPVTKNVLPNAVIGTIEDGDFWYGDINLASDNTTLQQIADTIQKDLLINYNGVSTTIVASRHTQEVAVG